MSSESEDEFQSADEGSDLEELECNLKTSVHQPAQSVCGLSCERGLETEEEETQSEAVKELNIDALNIGAEVDTDNNKEDTSERTKKGIESEKSHPEDVLCLSKEESVPVPISCIESEECVEERPIHQLEVDQCSKDNDGVEVCEKSNSCIEKIKEERIKPETKEKKDDKFRPEEHKSNVQNVEGQAKEVIEDAKEKPEDAKCELEESSSQTASSENSKKGNTADEVDILVPNSKPRPIRQSKIGMKKPREKLGERLGAKKLGTKVATKSTDSITSSDSMRVKEEEDKDTHTSSIESGGQFVAKTMEQDRGKEDEKMKKRQQWEEQQERWHQALNFDKDKKEASSGDGDGWSAPWGGWGGTLLSAASTFTREVGRGVGTVVETVESSIGVPSPEVMAQEICQADHHSTASEETTTPQGEVKETEREKQGVSVGGEQSGQQVEARYGLGGFSLGSLVSGVSGALETASSKVLMGGLDTLEVIGRKAMDVIQEGDPGLHKKRAFLSNKKPNLAQMLQEARQRATEEERDGVAGGGNNKNLQKASFEQAWEATEGPVHLEALSLVAKQCQSKMSSMIATLPHYVQEKLLRQNALIKTTCELDEVEQQEEDLPEVVSSVLTKMALPLHPQKLIEAWSLVQEKATFVQEIGFEETGEAEGVLYGAMAQLMAQLCALAHKGGELALITPETDCLDLASHFKELGQTVSCGLENVADQVCGTITSEGSVADPQISNTITNIYLQAASGNNYIQESLVLLASILQYSNTKSAAAHL